MRRIATILAFLLVLASCGGDDGADAPATTTSTTMDTTTLASTTSTTKATTTTTTTDTTSTTEGTTTTTTPPIVGEAQTDPYQTPDFPGSGFPALLQDVRTETYDDFVRLVFEFDTTIPEYLIEYVEGPIKARPSGNDVDLDGDAFLAMTMAPASTVDLSGDEPVVSYDGPERIEIDANEVTDLVVIENFESHLTWVVGLDSVVPFSFSTLDDPARVVVDLHTGEDS